MKLPQGGSNNVKDYELSRFCCYLVAMNSDPDKEMVAQAQGYFAAKTHEAESPKTRIQMLVEVAQQMAAQEQIQIAQAKELELVKQQQALEAARVDELVEIVHQHDGEIDRLFSPNGHYFSVLGYARNRGLKIGTKTASRIGKQCSAYCKAHNITVEKLPDARWGIVGSYPEDVIELYI